MRAGITTEGLQGARHSDRERPSEREGGPARVGGWVGMCVQ